MINRQLVATLALILLVAAPRSTWASPEERTPARTFAQLRDGGELLAGSIIRVSYRSVSGHTAVLTGKLAESRVDLVERRSRKVGKSAATGLLAGGVLGFAAGQDCSTSSDFICFGRGETALGLGLVGTVLGALLGLFPSTEVVYAAAPPAPVSEPGRPGADPNVFVPVSPGREESGTLDRRPRLRVTAYGGAATQGEPGAELENAFSRAGLAGTTPRFFGGSVTYPTSSARWQGGLDVEYRIRGRLGASLAWLEGDIGRTAGAEELRHASVVYGLRGIGALATYRPAERVRLAAGPVWYRLSSSADSSGDLEPVSMSRPGLLADLQVKIFAGSRTSVGLKVQYRLAGSLDIGSVRSSGFLHLQPISTDPVRLSYNHLFVGGVIELGF